MMNMYPRSLPWHKNSTITDSPSCVAELMELGINIYLTLNWVKSASRTRQEEILSSMWQVTQCSHLDIENIVIQAEDLLILCLQEGHHTSPTEQEKVIRCVQAAMDL